MSDLVFARNCSVARMLPGEAENGVGMNRSARGGKMCEVLSLSGPTDRILRHIKTTFTFYFNFIHIDII